MYSSDNEANVSTDPTMDKFKPVFKYFKSNDPPPDMSKVLKGTELFEGGKRVVPNVPDMASSSSSKLGLVDPESWEIADLSCQVPGLYMIRNPFTPSGQLRWCLECLRNYARCPPNRTNLKSDTLADGKQWFELVKSTPKLLPKLRWATLGLHHDWDTKVYSKDNVSEFPPELRDLCEFLAEAAGFPGLEAEAAIVNFYPMGSTLSGHVDRSEPNMKAPLVSVSFGSSAVFLIGGPEKSSREPVPILIDSGDVVIMSGEARKSYHAVPRIIKERGFRRERKCDTETLLGRDVLQVINTAGTYCYFFAPRDDDYPLTKLSPEDPDEAFVVKYLSMHRVNINVRQVH